MIGVIDRIDRADRKRDRGILRTINIVDGVGEARDLIMGAEGGVGQITVRRCIRDEIEPDDFTGTDAVATVNAK